MLPVRWFPPKCRRSSLTSFPTPAGIGPVSAFPLRYSALRADMPPIPLGISPWRPLPLRNTCSVRSRPSSDSGIVHCTAKPRSSADWHTSRRVTLLMYRTVFAPENIPRLMLVTPHTSPGQAQGSSPAPSHAAGRHAAAMSRTAAASWSRRGGSAAAQAQPQSRRLRGRRRKKAPPAGRNRRGTPLAAPSRALRLLGASPAS
mmetsp:Transcript_20352/g.50004  ORF Transcript_20352/g.50004 Transcript_20352/m.50004 type:complete len:202 (-) Transcript_20352:264-869(-)